MMSKANFFTGQPIFTQILSLVPRTLVQKLARKHQSDHYTKHFGSYEHLVTMLYAVFHRCSSLREVVSGMLACALRLQHLGLRSTPRRSTLADANKNREEAFFCDLYHELYRLHYGGIPERIKAKNYLNRLYIVDSTTVSLFSTVLKGTGSYGSNGKKKGGIKAHLCLRACQDVGAFICLTEGKANDNTFLPRLHLPTGSIVVFDKGYRSYARLLQWTQQGITWVSRLQAKAVYRELQDRPLTEKHSQEGILRDVVIELGNPATADINPLQRARLITYRDAVSGKCFAFVTNNFHFAPTTIAAIYKRRWQIELLFKRIKGSFQLHFFMGDSENAIKVQLWCTLIADLLITLIKDRVQKGKVRWSMANLSALVRLHLTTYIDLFAFLKNPEKSLLGYEDPYHKSQLTLFAASPRGA